MMALLPVLLQVLPTLAPLIASGKMESLIATGAKVAMEVFGTDDPATVKAEVESNPAAAEQFRVRLEQETAQLQAELADVQDARSHQVQLVQADSMMGWAPAVLSIIVVGSFVALVFALLFKSAPENNVTMVLFGTLATAFGQVLGFWLGSSQGSRQKDFQLAALAASATTPSPGQVASRVAAAVVKGTRR